MGVSSVCERGGEDRERTCVRLSSVCERGGGRSVGRRSVGRRSVGRREQPQK